MLASVQTSETVPLVGIDLQLVRLAGFDQGVYQLTGMKEVYVLVY